MTPRPPDDERFKSPQAFRAAAADRIRVAARHRGQSPQNLRRRFLLQRFLARVFSTTDTPWVLKGGTAMAVRMPEARYSRDLDMLLEGDTLNLAWAMQHLRSVASIDLGDHLRFEINDPTIPAAGTGSSVEIKVTGYIDATEFDRFSIDLSTRPQLIGEIELVTPEHVIELPGMSAVPQIAVYPLPDQVADKVCAMYETHGPQDRPSTRYRDLVDLILITSTQRFDAMLTGDALRSEQRRRGMVIPDPLHLPGPQWVRGYQTSAREAGLPTEMQDANAALQAVADCLGPVLTAITAAGIWDPRSRTWRSA